MDKQEEQHRPVEVRETKSEEERKRRQWKKLKYNW
jgi:hypothetical protein